MKKKKIIILTYQMILKNTRMPLFTLKSAAEIEVKLIAHCSTKKAGENVLSL